jgi:GNAT superfamily N-acetyltransferase
MKVEVTSDPVAFRDAVSGLLQADPVRNSVMLNSVALRVDGLGGDTGPATYLQVLGDDGALVGTAMRTPPWNVLLGDLPLDAVGLVAQTMARECPDAAGVQGSPEHALDFAERWKTLVGKDFALRHGLRLHRLGTLTVPEAVGAPRLATRADLPLLVDWYDAFGVDVNQPMTRERNLQAVKEKLSGGRVWLWYDDDRPVSLVAHTPPMYGVSRVGPVYTAAEHRGHGYASALTAHVSRTIRDAGDDACLYTDLANPTSNKIYAAIGYEPVGDFVDYVFR